MRSICDELHIVNITPASWTHTQVDQRRPPQQQVASLHWVKATHRVYVCVCFRAESHQSGPSATISAEKRNNNNHRKNSTLQSLPRLIDRPPGTAWCCSLEAHLATSLAATHSVLPFLQRKIKAGHQKWQNTKDIQWHHKKQCL